MRRLRFLVPLLVPLSLVQFGCKSVKEGDSGHHDDAHGLVTSVHLTLTAAGSGESEVVRWEDPELDGVDVLIESIDLHLNETYQLDVAFINQAENPEEDVTHEVEEHAEDHQIFYRGSGVSGPASDNSAALVEQAYLDTDPEGLPLGLSVSLTPVSAGDGELELTLRHLPEQGGSPTKVAGLAEQVAADGGFSGIGGDTDVQVVFPLSVVEP